MGTMQGADPDAVDALAREMQGSAEQLRSVEQRMSTRVRAAPWEGRDAEGVRAEWMGQLARSVTAAAGALEGASTVAIRNAAEQRQASAAAGGALPSLAVTGALTGGLGGALLTGGAVAGLPGVALPSGAVAGGVLAGGSLGDALLIPRGPDVIAPALLWDEFMRWANTPQELPNSKYVSGALNTGYGAFQVGGGVLLVASGGAEDATGIGALLGIPSMLYGGFLYFSGSARVARGSGQLSQAQEHPTVVQTPLEYGEQIARDVLPGGSLLGIVGGIPG